MKINAFFESIARYAKPRRALLPSDAESIARDIGNSLAAEGGSGAAALSKALRDPAKYTIRDGQAFVEDMPLTDMLKRLQIGQFEAVLRKIDASIDLSSREHESLRRYLTRQAERCPAYHLNKIDTLIERMQRDVKKMDASPSSSSRLDDTNEFIRVLKHEANNEDSTIGQALRYIEKNNKRMRGFSVPWLPLVGLAGGITAFALYLEKYRDEMNGCVRYEMLANGGMTICKVRQCTCGPARYVGKSFCDNAKLPKIMQEANCPSSSVQGCVHCPPTSEDSDSSESAAAAVSSVEYRCVQMDLLGAMADFVGTNVERIGGELDRVGTASGASVMSILGYAKYILPVILVIVLLMVGFGAYKLLRKHDYYDDDDLNISSRDDNL